MAVTATWSSYVTITYGYIATTDSINVNNINIIGTYRIPVYAGTPPITKTTRIYSSLWYGNFNNIANWTNGFDIYEVPGIILSNCYLVKSNYSTLYNKLYNECIRMSNLIPATYDVLTNNVNYCFKIGSKTNWYVIEQATNTNRVESNVYVINGDSIITIPNTAPFLNFARSNYSSVPVFEILYSCIIVNSTTFYLNTIYIGADSNNKSSITGNQIIIYPATVTYNTSPTTLDDYACNDLYLEVTGKSGSILECTIDYEYNWDYTGSAIIPPVTITLNNQTLFINIDYTLTYSDNINVGFGKILVTGINNFTDSTILIFRINESDDPFSPGGSTDTDGGDGDFDDSSDTVPAPSLPSISALGSKITTIWVPTQSELQSFAEWFFSTNLLDIQTYIRTFANPIEFILGLSIVPLNVSYTTNEVVIGLVSSGVSMRRALTQFITFDCGTVNINEYWGAYLDYSPYTKIDLFLPFIGFRQLDADVVMGHTVNIKYNCDILSGACVAFVLVDGTVAYTFSGNMATQIPISGIDLTSIIATAATVATVGIGAVAAGVGAASGVSGSFLPITDKIATVGKAIGSNLAEGASAVASKVIGTKQNIEKSGSISGSAGILSNKTPYLVINRPRQAVPDSQSHFTGYPGFINYKLQALSGYTVVEHIHLDNAPCTDDEAAELLTILKGGFVI